MEVLAALALVAAAASIGALVLAVLRAEAPRPIDGVLASLAVGNGVLGLAGLAVAAAGVLRPAVVWLLLLGAIAAGGRRVGRTLVVAWRERQPLRAPDRLVAAALVAQLGAVLVMVNAPVLSGDQTKYQLAYPKLYAAAGGLVDTPWTFWGQQQFLENFLFALAFVVGDERTAVLTHAAIGVVARVAAGRLVARWVAPGWGWATTLVLATQPMTWSMFRASGSDLPVVAYTVLAVTALVSWTRGEGEGGLRRAALVAGLAGGTKVMGLLTPTLVGVLAIVHAGRRGGGRAIRTAVVFGCLAGLGAAGPYVRNAAEVGNPLHPFGHGVFGGRNWNADAAAYLDEYYRQYRVDRATRRPGGAYEGVAVLRFPWDLTMYPESFERSMRSALDVGPLMLAALPAAIWVAVLRPAPRLVAAVGALHVAIIAGTTWAHPRYVLPGVVLLSIAGIGGLARLFGTRLLAGVLALTVGGHVVVIARMAGPLFPDQVRVAAGRLSRDAFLARHSARYRFWRAVDRALPPGVPVVVLGKIPHPYVADRPVVLASYLEQVVLDYRSIGSPAELLTALRGAGARYVAFDLEDLGRAADPYEQSVTALWRALRERLDAPVVRESGWELYAVPPAETRARRS